MLKSVEVSHRQASETIDPDHQATFVDLRYLGQLLKRNKTFIIACILVFGAIGLGLAKLTPPTYTASSQVIIDPRRLDLFQKDAVFTGAPVDVGTMESQVQQLASTRIAQRTFTALNLLNDPEFNGEIPTSPLDVVLEALKIRSASASGPGAREAAAMDAFMKKLTARRIGLSYVIEAQFVSVDPEKAARIVNTIADEYIEDAVAGRIESMQRAGAWLEDRLEELGKRATASEQALNNFKAEPKNTSPAELYSKVKELESNVSTYRSLYDNFLQRYMQVLQQQSYPTVDARVSARASPPTEKSGPKTLLYIAAAVTFGALLGGGVTFTREMMDGSIRTQHQAALATGAPSLGLLPQIDDRTKTRVRQLTGERLLEQRLFTTTGAFDAVESDRFSFFTETMRNVKIAADGAKSAVRTRVIGVCSLMPDEGAAMVAVNLALLTAGSGSRTLLIDTDMRRPHLSERLAPEARAGFAEVVCDPILMASATYRHAKLATLDFLPASAHGAQVDSYRVLSGEGAPELIGRCLVDYDYIVVSMASLKPLVDVRAALPLIEGMVIAARWGATQQTDLQAQVQSLDALRDKLLGVVLVDVDLKKIAAYEPGVTVGAMNA